MRELTHKVDFCIVGGGMAGLCAAISAARHGVKVALMQDRPVLGGNASSEIRMWVCGAHGDNNRETGIIEEIELESLYRNNPPNYHIWDSVLFEKAKNEKNIKLFLNCSCNEVKMDGDKIKSIKGWQLTTETWHTIEANYFADCSGDSILAPLTGAEFRLGRESSKEFNESIEPEVADKKTMGMSCLIQMRETDRPQTFIPPTWANKYLTDDDLPNRQHYNHTNFWWIELGGDKDSIHDTEELRDELLKIAFGVWDHMKNHGDHGLDNWVLDWIGFLPGKRESRRYVGDHILTQNDVRAEGRFDDLVAYGGWSMDDHHPEGFNYPGYPTIYHEAPSPFGIPYRCLYSKNINNLLFAGRNISATHAAMSATRVMATCAVAGQAVGTAVSIAVNKGLSPRGVYENEINTLKQMLMDDDCYLPFNKRKVSPLTLNAKIIAPDYISDASVIRNGIDRPIGDNDNGIYINLNDSIQYKFNDAQKISEISVVFDSDLNRRIHNMPCRYPLSNDDFHVPTTLVKSFKLEALGEDGNWFTVLDETNNYQRFIKIPIDISTSAVRLTPTATHGAEKAHIFSWYIK